MNLVESLFAIVVVLVIGYLVYQDKQVEADLVKQGLCAVQLENPRGGIDWVYRPCGSLK
jgi:hypothetical protein